MTTDTATAFPITPTYEQVKVALALANEIDRLNRPELEYNREVRDENAACTTFFFEMLTHGKKGEAATQDWVIEEILPEYILPQVPLKHVLPAEHADVLKRERAIQANLRARSPQEWRERIDRIPYEFRLAIASIVWWDFFSEREVKERWDELDEYVDAFYVRSHANDAPHPIIKQYLAELGYSPFEVETRLLGNRIESKQQ